MSALPQFDLFCESAPVAAPPAPAAAEARPRALYMLPDEPAPPERPARALSGLRAFALRHIPIWTKRAAMVREGRPTPQRGAERVAGCLELVIAKLALEACAGDALAALKLRRESLEPYPHPRHPEITVYGGPLMDEAREALEAAIAAMETAA